jgi:outer membrane protein assembly factor BamB
VVLVALQWLVILVPRWLELGLLVQVTPVVFGPFVVATAVAVWWLFASRLAWADRVLVLLACGASGAAAFLCFDPSLGVFGLVLALRTVTTAWVLWLLATPFLSWPSRRAGLLVLFLLVWGCFTLLRRDGADGSLSVTFHFRWVTSAEDKYLAELAAGKHGGGQAAGASTAEPVVLQPGDWPGFRGPDRDGRRTGVRIATDWKAHPPRLLWRHRVGPGWSSFAVVGGRLFTQEQRGADEAVVCYDAETGAVLWAHEDHARFHEEQSGPGPRATPTFHEGRLYTLGAAGRLNCLDAATGRALWSRDVAADAGAKVPQWGFASSPLVAQGVVSVFADGPAGKGVLGYHATTGELVWSADSGQGSYSSPHRARLGGVEQLLIGTGEGLTAFHPAGGEALWRFVCPRVPGPTCVLQPTPLGGSDVLLSSGGSGTRRVRVSREGGGWVAREVWTTRAIKPFFNDLVVHQGHLYGFDVNFFTCVSLEDGQGKWRARGYGSGQVLLLADQGLLLVLTEKGAVALVEATSAGHRELGRFQAIEGKTWNHPVVSHGKLFVRNSEEAACYRLAEAADGGVVSAGNVPPSKGE